MAHLGFRLRNEAETRLESRHTQRQVEFSYFVSTRRESAFIKCLHFWFVFSFSVWLKKEETRHFEVKFTHFKMYFYIYDSGGFWLVEAWTSVDSKGVQWNIISVDQASTWMSTWTLPTVFLCCRNSHSDNIMLVKSTENAPEKTSAFFLVESVI